MCTVVILRRPDHPWPIILGANRDEMLDRPWRPPARHWPDRTDVVAGLDELGGGTWMGLNDAGVVACVLNRHGTLGPAADKRSRGELVLEALDHADARDAAEALSQLDPNAYRPFNLVIADNRDAWWLALTAPRQESGAGVRAEPIPPGLSMLTAGDLNAPTDERISLFQPRLVAAAVPDPDAGDWADWRALLAAGPGQDPEGKSAMCFHTEFEYGSYGTSSSSLMALPAVATVLASTPKRPIWLFASIAPEYTSFRPVDL